MIKKILSFFKPEMPIELEPSQWENLLRHQVPFDWYQLMPSDSENSTLDTRQKIERQLLNTGISRSAAGVKFVTPKGFITSTRSGVGDAFTRPIVITYFERELLLKVARRAHLGMFHNLFSLEIQKWLQ